MSTLDEYAEKIAGDGFKRQLDQEENVVRSLPFVVAGVGLIGTLVNTFHPALCKFDPYSFLSWLMYGASWGMGLAAFGILYGLAVAVRWRDFEYPMDELEFLRFVKDTTAYYAAEGAPADQAEAAALRDARAAITRQLAECAHANRPNNRARDHGRAIALNGLVTLMALGAAIICLVRLRQILLPGVCHG